MTSRFDRRSFLHATTSLGTVLALPGLHSLAAAEKLGPNEEIAVGMIGAGGRAGELFRDIQKLSGVKVLAVADPDSDRAAALADKCGAQSHSDLRKLIDDPRIHAVFISACNHWHCLAAIWAIEAGKDVYVEKPLSVTQWEGAQVIRAARKHGRMVQVGTQQRSDPMQAELKNFLHQEKGLGEILYAQANRLGARASIGRRSTPLEAPKNVDYDLWLGPAEDTPIYRENLHYDWHWVWNTGSGEMGTWGVHVLDDVRNVAYQDSVSTPTRIVTVGGRVAWNDAGETPNVHYAIFETESFPTLIALSNLPAGADGKGSWTSRAGRPAAGPGSGYVVACEGGYLLGSRQKATVIDRDGKEIRSFKGGNIVSLHIQNFLSVVRSRVADDLNAEVQVGHDSTGWCNLANVGYRASTAFSTDQTLDAGAKLEAWPKLIEEMRAQLKPLGISESQLRVSPSLTHDPKTERFIGDHAEVANPLLTRTYRKGFEVREIG